MHISETTEIYNCILKTANGAFEFTPFRAVLVYCFVDHCMSVCPFSFPSKIPL